MVARRKEVEKPQHPTLLCSSGGCPYEARVKVKNLLLCYSCRDAQVTREHAEWCKAHGLDTLDKQKAYCRTLLKRGIVKQSPGREPGQDDEGVTA